MIMSIAPTNLRTESKSGCAAAPNNPGLASSETEPGGCDAAGPQYQPNSADAVPAETEPVDAGVPHAELERQNVGTAGCEDDPKRRPASNAVLLWTTILVLFCASLLADAVRRTLLADVEESRRAAASSPIRTRRASEEIPVLIPHAPVSMRRVPVDVPKGQSQISPGQHPGDTSTTNIRAL
jgi:hypothetical protein